MSIAVPSAVIFDLDGTLINSEGDILCDLNAAIKAEGFCISGEVTKKLIGPPMLDIVMKLLPNLSKEAAHKIVDRFRAAHDSSTLGKSYLYEGVVDALEHLKSSGVRIYLATNKPRTGVLNIFNRFKLNEYFSDMACHGDPQIDSKSKAIRKLIVGNSLDKSKSWMVGDAPSDILAAKDNGLFSIAHVGGYSTIDDVAGQKPDLLLNTMTEFTSLVKRVI